MTAQVDQETLRAARAYLWHQSHRSRCHYARRDACECQACEGKLHKAGGIGLGGDIPPELLAQLEAETQPDRKAPRTPGPRRHRRNTAQLSMLLSK